MSPYFFNDNIMRIFKLICCGVCYRIKFANKTLTPIIVTFQHTITVKAMFTIFSSFIFLIQWRNSTTPPARAILTARPKIMLYFIKKPRNKLASIKPIFRPMKVVIQSSRLRIKKIIISFFTLIIRTSTMACWYSINIPSGIFSKR